MRKNVKAALVLFVVITSGLNVFANQIICNDLQTKEMVVQFASSTQIPDFNSAKFQTLQIPGSVGIHGKNFGNTTMTVRNAGFDLVYEIRVLGERRRPVANATLTLNKSGIFNGYVQNAEGQIQMLECVFAEL